MGREIRKKEAHFNKGPWAVTFFPLTEERAEDAKEGGEGQSEGRGGTIEKHAWRIFLWCASLKRRQRVQDGVGEGMLTWEKAR